MNKDQTITTIEDVPVIDMEKFMTCSDERAPEIQQLCKDVVESLHKYGILIVKDPRAVEQDNNDYIDLMERYFESRGNKLYAGETVEDFKPEYHF